MVGTETSKGYLFAEHGKGDSVDGGRWLGCKETSLALAFVGGGS